MAAKFDRKEWERQRHLADPKHGRKYDDWRKKNLVAQRKCRSGWTEEMVQAAWIMQEGCCAICGKHLVNTNKAHADHVGVRPTWVQRGLLCKMCNSRLGWFESRRETIEVYINKGGTPWQ